MAETDTTNVLDYLRAMNARIDARFAAIELWQRETSTRLTLIEHHLANLTLQYASLSERLDNLSQRVERIERRLDLVDH